MGLMGSGLYNSYGNSVAASITLTILLIVSFVAAIVLTVILYKKYVGQTQPGQIKQEWSWGSFFRFDKLLIEPVLKILYMFNALLTVFVCVSLIIATGVEGGFLAFLIGLIAFAIVCFFAEVFLRLGYEFTLLLVLIRHDTKNIRLAVAGASAESATPASGVAPAPAPAVETWDCSCGHTGNTGGFCSQCGQPRA